ncbi:MAG: M48 family peptidase [Acidobacteriia bacterium]|nr:M48 family peptidase [Terriglobia bacterium]
MHPRLLSVLQRAYRDLRPRAPMPEFRAEFFPFANINNTIRVRGGQVKVRVSDLLEGAPEDVLYAIAHILIAKLYRKPIDTALARRYRQHCGRRDLNAKAHLVRQLRGRKRIDGARGRVYDLEAIFDELNTRYFYGLLARPQMTWSREPARHALGHYDPAHNAIVVSRAFDRPQAPRYAVEYIVYHEMLHLKHPVRLRGGRRCVHSPQFQAEEKLFPRLEEAKRFLKTL